MATEAHTEAQNTIARQMGNGRVKYLPAHVSESDTVILKGDKVLKCYNWCQTFFQKYITNYALIKNPTFQFDQKHVHDIANLTRSTCMTLPTWPKPRALHCQPDQNHVHDFANLTKSTCMTLPTWPESRVWHCLLIITLNTYRTALTEDCKNTCSKGSRIYLSEGDSESFLKQSLDKLRHLSRKIILDTSN